MENTKINTTYDDLVFPELADTEEKKRVLHKQVINDNDYDEEKYWVLYNLITTLFKAKNGNTFIPYHYQMKIVYPIFYKLKKRVVITAPTRAGKSDIISILSILFCNRYPGAKIGIVSATFTQSAIIMNNIFAHLSDSDITKSWLREGMQDRVEKLGTEMSKTRIVYTNKSETSLLSGSGTGERLLGAGFDLVIVDESPLISDETFNQYIFRMLGDSPDAILIEIGNPIKRNHFFLHFTSKYYTPITINWKDCYVNGRFSKDWILENKESISPLAFKIMYDAEFPSSEGALYFPPDVIDKCIVTKNDIYKHYTELENTKVFIGFDVARNNDLSAISIVEEYNEILYLRDLIYFRGKPMDEQRLFIESIVDTLQENKNQIFVRIDMTGMGTGIVDELYAKYGSIIDGINFAKKFKHMHVKGDSGLRIKDKFSIRLRNLFNKQQIRFFKDELLYKDLTSVDMLVSLERKENGHCDTFVSLGLACLSIDYKYGKGSRLASVSAPNLLESMKKKEPKNQSEFLKKHRKKYKNIKLADNETGLYIYDDK